MSRATGLRRAVPFIATALLTACATPEDIRSERHLFREKTLPMSLDETERYIEDIVLECSVHFILRNVHRDPSNPARLTAVVEHTRVSAVVDFEEIVPGQTRVRTYAPNQLFRNSGIRSMYRLLQEPCPGALQRAERRRAEARRPY